jgi:Mn-dependent DtxR family transcriptional regulator
MAKTSKKVMDRVLRHLEKETLGTNKAIVVSDIQKYLGIRPESVKETLDVLSKFNQIKMVSNGKITLVWVEREVLK